MVAEPEYGGNMGLTLHVHLDPRVADLHGLVIVMDGDPPDVAMIMRNQNNQTKVGDHGLC
jgi:hypothetical protein